MFLGECARWSDALQILNAKVRNISSLSISCEPQGRMCSRFEWWLTLIGDDLPIWHTWIILSVEHEAKVSSFFQSTSKAGASWKLNCCFISAFAASQIIVVLSTPADRIYFPFLFHFRANIGPLCPFRSETRLPVVDQIRAYPSYEPVANCVPELNSILLKYYIIIIIIPIPV